MNDVPCCWAHCIKIMASGGVASPTDKLTSTQFSLGEMRSIVEEAVAVGTYVCAHAYTPASIMRALECGVRCIEHGNQIDEPTAAAMAAAGATLVPTLITYEKLVSDGEASGMPAELVAKVGDILAQGLDALRFANAAGCTVVFGSDLLGAMQAAQCEEFDLRATVEPRWRTLQSATILAAELFQVRPPKLTVAFSQSYYILMTYRLSGGRRGRYRPCCAGLPGGSRPGRLARRPERAGQQPQGGGQERRARPQPGAAAGGWRRCALARMPARDRLCDWSIPFKLLS
jgi:hypothetical protein